MTVVSLRMFALILVAATATAATPFAVNANITNMCDVKSLDETTYIKPLVSGLSDTGSPVNPDNEESESQQQEGFLNEVFKYSPQMLFLSTMLTHWKGTIIFIGSVLFYYWWMRKNAASSSVSFKCVNGGSSNPSMEYASSPVTRKQMENVIHTLLGHPGFDLNGINPDVIKIAKDVLKDVLMNRKDSSEVVPPSFPEKLEKSKFEPFSMDLEKMVELLKEFVPLYKKDIDGLIVALIKHYTSHPEFHTITLFQLAMVVAQDVTTIVYYEFVLAQVEHQRAIANTKSIQQLVTFLCKQEFDGNVPEGYVSFEFKDTRYSKNQTAVLMRMDIKGGSLYAEQTKMTEGAKNYVDSKHKNGAFNSVKADRLTVVIVDGYIVVSAHFSAPSSKLHDETESPFPKKQCDILLDVIIYYMNYLEEYFPEHMVIFGADWNIPKVKDTINLAKAAAKRGIYIGNDTQSETGFSKTEHRKRSAIASLQRLKWGLPVHAAKMAIAMSMSLSKRVKLSVQEGVEFGTPGRMINGDHAEIGGEIDMNFFF